MLKEFLENDYFCEHFYAECSDGHPFKWDDEKIKGRLLQELGKVKWPLPEEMPEQDRVFDYVEFFYDFVSKPTETWYHSWCHNRHPTDYEAEKGRFEYRERINKLFRNFRHPYDLDTSGRIKRETSPVLDIPIRDADFEIGDEHLNGLLNQALSDFYDRTGTKKLQAVRSLVDAFERLKSSENEDKKQSVEKLIQHLSPFEDVQSALNADMKELTDVANNFAIRHHELSKKVISDPDLLDFLFYEYYNIVRLILRKYKRQHGTAQEELGSEQ